MKDSDRGEADKGLDAAPAAVGASAATDYIAAPKQLVCMKGLRDEHLGALKKLETSIIGSAFLA